MRSQLYFLNNLPKVRLFHLEVFQLLLLIFIFDNREYTGELVMTGRFFVLYRSTSLELGNVSI
jgi:hypothetical protein